MWSIRGASPSVLAAATAWLRKVVGMESGFNVESVEVRRLFDV